MRLTKGQVLTGFLTVVLGCDPVAINSLQVVPAPATAPEARATSAFSVVERVALGHGLQSLPLPKDNREQYVQCFWKDSYYLCGKRVGNEAQFRSYQVHIPHFTAWAAQFNRELADSLGAAFGAGFVRPCRWRMRPNAAENGCDAVRVP